MDKSIHSLVLFIDFSKAFDTIPHPLLLSSLENIGIRGNTLNLFKNYILNRTFRVKIDDQYSVLKDISYGVPQGSKLGPLLFIIFTNSFLNAIKVGKVYAYADDTAIVISHRCIDSANQILQEELDRIGRWCHDNGLILNANKTKILHIRPKHVPQTTATFHYRDPCPINNVGQKVKIDVVKDIKYLGVFVEEFLTWQKQTEHIESKLRQVSYILKNLSYLRNKDILKNVYFALGEAHIRYGITAWGSSKRCVQLQKCQNRVINLLRKSHVESSFLTIEKIYKTSIFNEFSDMPHVKVILSHGHETRGSVNGFLRIGKARNRFGQYTLPNIIPRICNELPQQIKEERDLKKKKKISSRVL